MLAKAPLWAIVANQLASIFGDLLGQRCARKHFHCDAVQMLLVMTVVSAVEVLVLLTVVQLVLPASITGALYSGSTRLPCFREVDLEGAPPSLCPNNISSSSPFIPSPTMFLDSLEGCTEIPCPSQGPLSLPRSVSLHPLFLLYGFTSVVYYTTEVMLYQQPLGLVLIVLAALLSSTLLAPLETLFGMAHSPINPWVLLLGTLGSVLCVYEPSAGEEEQPSSRSSDHQLPDIDQVGILERGTGGASADAASGLPLLAL
eukprot:RCo030930